MSGVGAFVAGAAIGAVVGKKIQKNHDKKHHPHHMHGQHYTTGYSQTVVHQPPQQVHHQTHVVYVNKPSKSSHPPHGYPSHGHPPQGYPPVVHHAPPQGYPSHGHPQQGYPQGHQQPQYIPPPPHSTQAYPQSGPVNPGYPPQIGFQGPSPYPAPGGYSNPPLAPAYDGYPQAPGYPPAPSGYPSNGYPPMPASSSYPPPAALPQQGANPFQLPTAHPQSTPVAPSQGQSIQAQVTVQLNTVSTQQSSAGGNMATTPNRRYFVLQNEETRYALHVDTVSGSRLVMRQRTATGSWDPQWVSGQGQAQGQGQLWYLDGEGILRNQMNDLAIEAKDGGSWLSVAPYRGDPRQQWILRDGRILSNRATPSECICLEEGLMGTAVNADVIVTQYQGRRHNHWVVEYV